MMRNAYKGQRGKQATLCEIGAGHSLRKRQRSVTLS
ncbi:Unknown protein sequence [Pseudomonas amygdali pv. mellea]|uniref:Uncharacterized protein n=1 Tax=Pseudomonas syringae pv. actinidiae TaxID=103796 RepID=A0A7Z6UEK5_PSESF|nr:Unknown protein sequence [Pseudomonas amygdali]KPX87189.1 Unknown protein sequence [Pseudomonas amygdali pv. mellea]RMR53320.1 hypothetical protein ALP83_02411 [Pseudomonas syringae pv. actinidiae]